KITNDKPRETEGKLQKAKGKAKDKVTDLKDTLEDKKEG
ncbi:CsbD family protein, partial [Salmonella enterica subsp. enterica serovar Istanbul]|nr:CsbD family protein [Salmonella enterica subsp. enterica serovar Istanbul]